MITKEQKIDGEGLIKDLEIIRIYLKGQDKELKRV